MKKKILNVQNKSTNSKKNLNNTSRLSSNTTLTQQTQQNPKKLTVPQIVVKPPSKLSSNKNLLVPQKLSSSKAISHVSSDKSLKTTTDKPALLLVAAIAKNLEGSVYDKYRETYSKFVAKNKDKIKLKTGEEDGDAKKKELTPMPQFQKKTDSNITKDVFTKVERSAVVMRRMEYTAKLRQWKKKKIQVQKAKLIQRIWRKYHRHVYLRKVKIIQKFFRGYMVRRGFKNTRKIIKLMIAKFRRKGCLMKVFKHFIRNLKKTRHTMEMGCQADILVPPPVEETNNEKLLEVLGGNKNPGTLSGVKTFPRLRTEIGNNDKMIKKYMMKYNKKNIKNNDIQISSTNQLKLNCPITEEDTDATDLQRLLFNSKKAESSRSVKQVNTMRLLKLIPKKTRWCFMTKMPIKKEVTNNNIESSRSNKSNENVKKTIQFKLFIMLFENYITKSVKNFCFNNLSQIITKPHHVQFPTSLFSIEDEVDDSDKVRIEQMKTNFKPSVGKISFLLALEENETENESNKSNKTRN